MGLFRGLWAPFRGAAFVAKHGLWGHVAVPLVANTAVAFMAGGMAYWFASRWAPDHPGPWWQAGTAALALLLVVPAFLILYPVVSSPFIDILTEKAESIVAGGHPTAGYLVGAVQAVLHGAAKSALYLLALALTLGLSIVSGPGALLGVFFGAIFLAYDAFDFPLARRRIGFLGKWRYLATSPGQTLGYAAMAALIFTIPLAFIIAPPFLAVGATLAYLDHQK